VLAFCIFPINSIERKLLRFLLCFSFSDYLELAEIIIWKTQLDSDAFLLICCS